MTLCPNCHHREIAGALFCSECGAQLVSASEHYTTQNLQSGTADIFDEIDQQEPRKTDKPSDLFVSSIDGGIALLMMDSGQVLQLADRKDFTLGRIAEGQPILPDVDLSQYDAYTLGVSRLHSSLKIIDRRVFISDLGSSNGTRVNNKKLEPQTDYPLKHGDVIALGKLKIKLQLHK
ncbi:MAG: FHA domain-containing protein [Anaerolineaceae bacterium]|nr:FHA domain-containing protein [Anaerolineaceae bacterium]